MSSLKTWDCNLHQPNDEGNGGTVILIHAKRFSGKTVLIKDIVYNNRNKFDEVYVFSKTGNFTPDKPFSYTENLYDHFDNELIGNIIETQKSEKMKQLKNPKHRVKKILLIFDDIISDKNIRKSKNGEEINHINELACNGRHYNITMILSTQILDAKEGFSTVVRKNVDYFITFKIFGESTLKMAAENFLSLFSLKEGKKIIQEITNKVDYNCIIVENYRSRQIKSYEDFCFEYIANIDIPQFEFQKKTLKKYHLNDDDDDDDDDDNIINSWNRIV